MSVIQTKSISGITSITTPSGSDNLLTIHTSDTTERVRVNNSGDVIVGTGLTLSPDGNITAGIITATTIGSGTSMAAAGLTGALPSISGANLTGLTQTTINTNANNRVITGSGTANTLNGESNVNIDGGIVIVGHTASTTVSDGETPFIQVKSTDSRGGASFIRHSANASGGGLYIGKSRNATIGSNTIVQSGDELGRITFSGDDGTDVNTVAAKIASYVDGTPGSNDMPGRLQFYTTADGAAAATERLRITSAGRVGINETSPDSLLHLKDSTDGGGSLSNLISISRRNGGSNDATIQTLHDGSDGIAALTVKFASTERIRITSAGNLLVGKDGVYGSGLTQVHATGQYTLDLATWAADANGPTIDFYKSRSATKGTMTVVQDDDVVGRLRFLGADGANGRTAAMITAYVDGTPGTNDMPGRLSFTCTRDGESSPREWMRITNNGTVTFAANDNSNSHANSNHRYVFDYGNIDATNPMRGVLIHASSGQGGGSSNHSYALKVDGSKCHNNTTNQYSMESTITQQYTANTHGIYSFNSSSYNTTYCYEARMDKNVGAATNGYCYHSNIWQTGNGGASYHFRAAQEDSTKLLILLNGNVQNVNNSYGSTSDLKLKENIVDANSQWNDLKAIKVRNFNFKDDPDKVKLLGIVAQEAETVSAGLVYDEKDITVNESTGQGTVTGVTKGVKYSILYMKAIKALQEAMTRIETLETKVAALESA